MLLVTLAAALLSTAVIATPVIATPVIEGTFDDWATPQISVADAVGDNTVTFDLTRLDIITAGTTFFASVTLADDVNMQNLPANPGLVWRFQLPGNRRFTFDVANQRALVPGTLNASVWTDLDFASMPTPAASRFEFRIDLGSPGIDAQPGDTVSLTLSGADTLDEPVVFTLDSPPETITETSSHRPGCTGFRIASLNTEDNWLVLPGINADRLKRMIDAVDADIYCFQEHDGVFFPPLPTAAQVLETINPHRDGAAWNQHFAAGRSGGNGILSRSPLTPVPTTNPIDGGAPDGDFVAALIELPQGPVLVFSIHPACCGTAGDSRDQSRVAASQRIAENIRRFRAGTIAAELTQFANAPVIVVGDYNLVGSFAPLEVLTDPAGPTLTDWPLLSLDGRDADTWRIISGQAGSFWPGRLDLLAHSTDLDRRSGFLLDTAPLSQAMLNSFDPPLEATDALASDHLFMVADFNTISPADTNRDGVTTPADFTTWLSLFNNTTSTDRQAADVNRDGSITTEDFFAWLDAFSTVCPD